MLWFLLLSGLILAIITLWQRKNPVSALTELATGVVSGDPMVIAANDKMDLDTYCLARAGQSEENLSSDDAKVAVMWAIKNMAKHKGISIGSLVLHTSWVDHKDHSKGRNHPEADMHFSRQDKSKYCTTLIPPSDNTKALAVQVMQSTIADPTGGAIQFDNTHSQAALHAANPVKYKSPEEIADDRIAAGMSEVTVDGVSTRFWRTT